MPRPCRCRKVNIDPNITYFKPRAIPLSELEEVLLQIDELEALRLADLEDLYHEDAAKKMGISRQTFDRILIKAHKTIADAIVNGKAIQIQGGNVMSNKRTFECSDCEHKWGLPFGTGRPEGCPQCKSENIYRSKAERGGKGSGNRGRGRCLRQGQNK